MIYEYVLGFVFQAPQEGEVTRATRPRVVLLHKERGPQGVAGWVNGIGGRIGGRIDPLLTRPSITGRMSEKARQEAGLDIPASSWRTYGTARGPGWTVWLLAASLPPGQVAHTTTDETVETWPLRGLPDDVVLNVPVLVEGAWLALINPSLGEPQGDRIWLDLEYSADRDLALMRASETRDAGRLRRVLAAQLGRDGRPGWEPFEDDEHPGSAWWRRRLGDRTILLAWGPWRDLPAGFCHCTVVDGESDEELFSVRGVGGDVLSAMEEADGYAADPTRRVASPAKPAS